MELSSIENGKLKLVKVLVKCINILCKEIDRSRSKHQFENSLRAMQLFENILYKIKNSSIVLSQEEHITQLTSVYRVMNEIFKNNV